MKYSVVVSFSMEGFHCWPEAKDVFPEVAFLSDQTSTSIWISLLCKSKSYR
jgi:hypothetical protein